MLFAYITALASLLIPFFFLLSKNLTQNSQHIAPILFLLQSLALTIGNTFLPKVLAPSLKVNIRKLRTYDSEGAILQ